MSRCVDEDLDFEQEIKVYYTRGEKMTFSFYLV